MKRLAVGILAHVDAGKTTLSEGLLYCSGSIRKLGRVDKKDAFLDTDKQERERGITIFSKQALLNAGETQITLLDTPGHVDFSAEMERTLQVMDYAILVISGSDGVQGHTLTLWRLLKQYKIPVFIFVNKMDQPDTDKEVLMKQLRRQLSEGCVDFSNQLTEEFYENIAMCEEAALDEFLTKGEICRETCIHLIKERKLFPCLYGSALKLEGIQELLEVLDIYTETQVYVNDFDARVFKISRDEAGNRLTHIKITGGILKIRDILKGTSEAVPGVIVAENWEEKINSIRIYSGEKFEAVNQAEAGTICAVTGLTKTKAGEGLGCESGLNEPILEPVLSYALLLPEEYDPALMLPKLRQLEEEEPQLHIVWDEKSKELKVQLMGQVQLEVLSSLIQTRFGVAVQFGPGTILYKETINSWALGMGHFEPLRHYAEVTLLLEAGERGSGLQFATDCREDILDRNWQRLILTHLQEKEHCGVLTGSPITDMKITLKTGRAHLKHTEGGDFRQATYRALRQGLMGAENVLLEPYYEFSLELPDNCIGRAMADIEKMSGTFELSQQEGESAILTGTAPMSQMQDYTREVASYTKGQGHLFCSLKGYFPCHNAEAVIEERNYDPEQDIEHTPDSVFCAHGAGFIVKWEQVPSYIHEKLNVDYIITSDNNEIEGDTLQSNPNSQSSKNTNHTKNTIHSNNATDGSSFNSIGTDEIESILNKIAYANSKKSAVTGQAGWRRRRESETFAGAGQQSSSEQAFTYKPINRKEQYLLVDGYNVIYAWPELKDIANTTLDGARGKLLDILCNYQAIKGCHLIAVFDAYRVAGHATEISDYHNIHVVYTAEAETADRYIEKFAHENSKKYDVTVATSDGLEQIIIIGAGCNLISSRELLEEIELTNKQLMEDYQRSQKI